MKAAEAEGLPIGALVGSAWGAVSVLPPVGFPGPFAEPAVPITGLRALHGFCGRAGFAVGQGEGVLVSR